MPEAMTIAGAMFAACLLLTVFALGLLLGVFKSIPGGATQTDLEMEIRIMAKLNELQAELAAVNTQLSKVSGEVLAKIAELTAALANIDLPPGAADALAELKEKAQALDDIVPDAPATTPTE